MPVDPVDTVGTVRHHYSKSTGCVCCPGRHRYASSVEGIEGSGTGWVHEQIRALPEGTRVRVTLEVVDHD